MRDRTTDALPEATVAGYEAIDPTALLPIQVGPGCRRFDLPSSPGSRAWIVEIDAGHRWPHRDHHNEQGEMVFVLEGELVEDGRSIPAGSYVRYGANSTHQPATITGVRLLGVNLDEDRPSPPVPDER